MTNPFAPVSPTEPEQEQQKKRHPIIDWLALLLVVGAVFLFTTFMRWLGISL